MQILDDNKNNLKLKQSIQLGNINKLILSR